MAIAHDNADWYLGSGTSASMSFTCSGSDRALVVIIVTGKTSDNVTGVTYGGVAMTKLSTLTPNGGGSDRYTYMFYLANPASGANNIVASANSSNDSFVIHASSYTGVDQSSSPENYTASKQSTNSTTYSATVTTAVSDCWIVGGLSKEGTGTVTVGANTTERTAGYMPMYDSGGARATGSNALNLNCDASRTWRSHLVSLKPSAVANTSAFFQLF